MELMVLGLVFIPLILLLIVLLTRGKAFYSSLIISSVIFLICSIVLYLFPNISIINFPALLWKFLSLLTVFAIFIYSIRDKHYFISILTIFQVLMLIVFEISFAPAEPSQFLSLNRQETLLTLSGVLSLLPLCLL